MSNVSDARRGFVSISLLGVGMVLVGAAGYAFIAVAGHTLPTAEAAAVSSFYLLVNIIGPGLFLAVEQETSRRTSHALAVGQPLIPVLRRTGRHAIALLLPVLAMLGITAPLLIDGPFDRDATLLFALVFAAICAMAVYLVRGLLGGYRRFTGYAATLAGEGLGRLLPVLAMALIGQCTAARIALAFAVGTAFSAVVGLPWLIIRSRAVRVDQREREHATPPAIGMGSALALLAVSTLLSHLVANLAPVVVTARLTTDTAVASAFAAAFILARVPLFLIAPVQALLMPAMTAAIARRDYRMLRQRLRVILVAVTVLGGLGVLGSITTGPWLVQILFGARVLLPGPMLGLLAASTVLLMAAQVLQPALIAFGSHRLLATLWTVCTVVNAGLLALPGAPLRAAVIAQLAGPALLVVGMVATLLRQLRMVCVPEYVHVGADT